ncbi:hypothetical protein TNCV_4184841 [Trichonephila clavipes]|nr:hypothetical protein TNCV_4184841 [Trichonephila clavipes]
MNQVVLTEYNGDQMTREMVKRKGYKRSHESRSGGPERKVQKGSEHRVPKRNLSSNDANSILPKYRKKSRREETVAPTTSGYNLRPRIRKREERVPTDHREEDTTRRTSSIQKRQRKERQSIHRGTNKIKQQECRTRRVTDPEVYKKLTYLDTKNGAKEKM